MKVIEMVNLACSQSLSWPEVLEKVAEYDALDRINFTSFDSSSVASIDLSDRSLSGSVFDGMSLRHLHADRARLVGAQFCGSDLEGSSFIGADLRGVDFSSANISYADFTDAQLDGACFTSCVGADLAKLPRKLQKKAQWTHPAVRRFVLQRYGSVLLIVSAASLPLTAVIQRTSPLGHANQQLQQVQSQLVEAQRKSALLNAEREKSESTLAAVQSAVTSEKQLLEGLKQDSWNTRASKTPGIRSLSYSEKTDIADVLDSLLFDTETSVQKFAMYFQMLYWVEQEFGSATRLQIVNRLVLMNSTNYQSLMEFVKLSAMVHGDVTQAQVEKVLTGYFKALDENPSGAFWSRTDLNWHEHWKRYFKEAGIL